MPNTNKAEELAKEYAEKQNDVYMNDYYGFIEGYNSRQSEIDELTKEKSLFIEKYTKSCDEVQKLEKVNDELTKEVERLRNKQQLAIDSLLKIRTDIFDNSSDQMLVKFGVNKIDTLLHQLTNP